MTQSKLLINKYFVLLFLLFITQLSDAQQTSKIDSLQNVLNNTKEEKDKIKVLFSIGNYYDSKGNYLKSREVGLEILKLSEKLHLDKRVAEANYALGRSNFYLGDYEKAHQYYQSSLNYFLQNPDKIRITEIKNNIGLVYMIQGNYPQASKNLYDALKLAEELQNDLLIYRTSNGLAQVYRYQEDFISALRFAFSCLEIAKKINSKKDEGNSYTLIGNIYRSKGNLDSALIYAMKALEFSKLNSDKISQGKASHNVGELIKLQAMAEKVNGFYSDTSIDKFNLALNYLKESLEISKETEDKYVLAGDYIDISETYLELNKLIDCKEFLFKAEDISQKTGNKEFIKICYELLSRYDSATGNYTSAYNNYKMHIAYRDSLHNEENTKKITKLQLQYEYDKKDQVARIETEKKNKEIELLNKEKELIGLQMENEHASLMNSQLETEKRNSENQLLKKSNQINELELVNARREQLKSQVIAKQNADELARQKFLRNGIILGIVLFVVIIGLLFNRFQLRKKIEHQDAILNERKRISSDLHDDIGSSLSKIALISEMIRTNPGIANANIEKVINSSRNALDHLSNIVWSLNASNDVLDNFIAYSRKYAVEYFEHSTINCKISVPPEIPKLNMSSEVRSNIFLCLKEILHNVVKHSGADSVQLCFDIRGREIEIKVQDNGKGFGIRDKLLGNGLINIQKRMNTIGGSFTIDSNEGTKALLRFDL